MVAAAADTLILCCLSHCNTCVLHHVESGWRQAPEGPAEASSPAGNQHGQLLLPLLHVQHKRWVSERVCIATLHQHLTPSESVKSLTPCPPLQCPQRRWTRATRSTLTPWWPICAPSNRSSAPSPSPTRHAARAKASSGDLGAAAPSTLSQVEAGAAEVANDLWLVCFWYSHEEEMSTECFDRIKKCSLLAMAASSGKKSYCKLMKICLSWVAFTLSAFLMTFTQTKYM